MVFKRYPSKQSGQRHSLSGNTEIRPRFTDSDGPSSYDYWLLYVILGHGIFPVPGDKLIL